MEIVCRISNLQRSGIETVRGLEHLFPGSVENLVLHKVGVHDEGLDLADETAFLAIYLCGYGGKQVNDEDFKGLTSISYAKFTTSQIVGDLHGGLLQVLDSVLLSRLESRT